MDSKMLCLGVLTLGDASGYEIKKYLEEGPIAHFHEISFGSIYPALGKLSAEGLVDWREERQGGRPAKKVYTITPAGTRALEQALVMPPRPDTHRSDALTYLFFGTLMTATRRREVFEGYLEGYRARLEHWTGVDFRDESPARRFVHDLGVEIYRAMVDFMEARGHVLFEDAPDRNEDTNQGGKS